MAKNRFYAVAVGGQPGIYEAWDGSGGAREQVDGFRGARYRGFPTRAEAEAWLARETGIGRATDQAAEPAPESTLRFAEVVSHGAILAQAGGEAVHIYTDGACVGNPGPGGYGVVIIEGDGRRELAGGFRLTTNNRMEILACIVGLRAYKGPAPVRLFSDSSYVVRAMSEGWAARWRAHGWWRNKRERAENVDLWAQLLELCEARDVEFVWVRGHSGHPMNERCDQLALEAARRSDLPPDRGYEEGIARAPEQLRFV